MEAEVLGIDHVYFSVRSLAASERFYDDALMKILGFRKNTFQLNGDPHIQYYNRQLGFVIRPARSEATAPSVATTVRGAAGLHHLCLRVAVEADVDRVASALIEHGIPATPPRYFPEYAPDYYATFFHDPDGTELEVTNFRAERRARMEHWDDPPGITGPRGLPPAFGPRFADPRHTGSPDPGCKLTHSRPSMAPAVYNHVRARSGYSA